MNISDHTQCVFGMTRCRARSTTQLILWRRSSYVRSSKMLLAPPNPRRLSMFYHTMHYIIINCNMYNPCMLRELYPLVRCLLGKAFANTTPPSTSPLLSTLNSFNRNQTKTNVLLSFAGTATLGSGIALIFILAITLMLSPSLSHPKILSALLNTRYGGLL